MTERIIRSEDQLDRMSYVAYVGNQRRIEGLSDAVLRRLLAQRLLAPEQERVARKRLEAPRLASA